jgi:hypothetical protein
MPEPIDWDAAAEEAAQAAQIARRAEETPQTAH